MTDDVDGFLDAERLADVTVNRVLGEDLAQPQFFGAGDDDDLHVRVELSQPLERFGAVKLRHVVVEQHELETVLLLGEFFEGLDRIGNRDDLDAIRLQQFGDEVAEFLVVVDGQGADAGAIGGDPLDGGAASGG